MRRLGLAACLALTPLAAVAQQDDRDYLTAFLEDSLSGAGRHVVVTGFEGLLSARATVQEITIADDQGIWLTLRGVTMDWSRSALLRGEINVSELSADEILVDRLPVSEPSTTAPEAGSFALPELPVSLRVDHVGAGLISLGPTILGTPVEAKLDASMSLAGGEGQASLTLLRTDDGPKGKVALTASFANADQMLTIDLDASEGADGIAATLIGIPGTPATSLTVKGAGPLTDFAADVALRTDGEDRLAGKVTLTGVETGGMGFGVDLAGDLAPLFLPDYATFFGDNVQLAATGTRHADGRLDLADLSLKASAMNVQGSLALSSDGLPQRFDLTAQIANPRGGSVLLPLTSDVETRLDSANVKLSFDSATDRGWKADIAVLGLDREDFQAREVRLSGSGRIARLMGARTVGGTFQFQAAGLAPQDPDLARAIGDTMTGQASMRWREGDGSFTVQSLSLAGADYGATVSGRIAGLNDALSVTGTAEVTAQDLSRFAGLAGRPIAGAGVVSLTGSGSPLTGAFDVQAEVRGTDLALGIAQVDQALRGQSQVKADVLRDTTGTTLRSFSATAGTIGINGSGSLASGAVNLTAAVTVGNLGTFGPGLRGSVSSNVKISGAPNSAVLTLDSTARGLAVGQAEADKLLAGETRAALGLSLHDGALFVDKATVTNPQLSVQADGTLRGNEQTISVKAQLNNLGLLLADFPGALNISGTLVQTASGTQVDMRGTGPGQIDARVKGRLARGFGSADLTVSGTSQAGLANPFIAPRVLSGRTAFDMRLRGPLTLASLSGNLTLADARLADPMLTFSLDGISGRVDLAGGRAKVAGSGRISTGGTVTVSGTAGLAAPFAGDFAVGISNAVIRDPQLYEVQLGGNITIKGPLTGGAKIAGDILLSQTELQVPSTSISGAGGLPNLIHQDEPVPVYQTRVRAGLVEAPDAAAGGPRRPYLLDVRISAPSQLFVRGRGLDAELGGDLRITGSTDNVIPIGSFDLIRGRLEILSRRLDLTTASLQLQGDFIPYIEVAATANADNAVVGVTIRGPADDPEVRFTSVPDMPDEEVLAQLLFGNNVQNLSVLQALELAGAVRTLAGYGGEGIISKLRRNVGLDNLDVTTNQNGDSTLTAGKYLTERIYTEVTVDAKGQSDIHLNFDVTKSITLQATAASDGTSTLGVKVEKDY